LVIVWTVRLFFGRLQESAALFDNLAKMRRITLQRFATFQKPPAWT